MVKFSNAAIAALGQTMMGSQWDSRIGKPSQNYWDMQKTLLTSEQFLAMRDRFFGILPLRIVETLIMQMRVGNQFAEYRAGSMGVGGAVQKMGFKKLLKANQYLGTKVSAALQMGDSPYNQFRPEVGEIETVYHAINRQQFYKTTPQDVNLRQAFQNEGGLQALIAATLNRLYQSDEWDSEVYFKKAIIDFAKNKTFPLLESQVIEMPDITDEDADVKLIRKFIVRLRKLILYIARNGQGAYNSVGAPRVSNPGSMRLLIDLSAVIQNEVQNLSVLFNPGYNTYGTPVKEINNWGVDDNSGATKISDNVIGVMHEDGWLTAVKTFSAMTQANDSVGLFTNHFWHIHESYRTCPFANSVYLVKDKASFMRDIATGTACGSTCTNESPSDAEIAAQVAKQKKLDGDGDFNLQGEVK